MTERQTLLESIAKTTADYRAGDFPKEAPAPAYTVSSALEVPLGEIKAYPVMKDSGVPWLGRVPEHWNVLPALAVYRPRQVKNTGLIEKTVLSLSYGRIIVKPPEKLRGLVPESFETYQIVNPGNIIVRTTDLQNDQTSLRVGHARHRGIITAAYLCLETKPDVLNEFGYQYLNAYDLLKIIYGFGSGLRQNLDFVDIKRMPVLVPPRDEQAAIVRFLDYTDRRIRRYICAKQKLIRLLEEQKQAIIHRAVTRGLEPNVRLKPSGLEWLGDVPEHWDVVRNKTVCRLGTGHTPSRKVPEYWVNCTVPWFTLGDVHQIRNDRVKYVYETKEKVSELGLLNSSAVKLPRNTVILSRTASVGWSAILGSDMATSQDFMAWTPGGGVLSEYLLAVLRAMRPEFARLMYGSTHNTIYMHVLHDFRMPLPPLLEQAAIVKQIDGSIASVRIAIDTAEREIALLREYRIRLVADVVTGKLDVRETAARLPEVTEEPETLREMDAQAEDEAEADYAGEAPEETEA